MPYRSISHTTYQYHIHSRVVDKPLIDHNDYIRVLLPADLTVLVSLQRA